MAGGQDKDQILLLGTTLLCTPPAPHTLHLSVTPMESWTVGLGEHGSFPLLDPTECARVGSRISFLWFVPKNLMLKTDNC